MKPHKHISAGMPHIESGFRKERLDAFGSLVSALPWFNGNVLHKFYINVFEKVVGEGKLAAFFSSPHVGDLTKNFRSYPVRSITCADLIQSPQVRRIAYNVFEIRPVIRNSLRLDINKEVLQDISEFMLAYSQDCHRHILSEKYLQAYQVEANLILNLDEEIEHITNHIITQIATEFQASGDMTDTISFYLNAIETSHGSNSQVRKRLQPLEHLMKGNYAALARMKKDGGTTIKIAVSADKKKKMVEGLQKAVRDLEFSNQKKQGKKRVTRLDKPFHGHRLFALCIGIDEYPSGRTHGHVNNARQFRDYLGLFVPESKIFSINFFADHKATKDNIVERIRYFIDEMGEGDLFFIYGAGKMSKGRLPDSITTNNHFTIQDCFHCWSEDGDSSYSLLSLAEIQFLVSEISEKGGRTIAIFDWKADREIKSLEEMRLDQFVFFEPFIEVQEEFDDFIGNPDLFLWHNNPAFPDLGLTSPSRSFTETAISVLSNGETQTFTSLSTRVEHILSTPSESMLAQKSVPISLSSPSPKGQFFGKTMADDTFLYGLIDDTLISRMQDALRTHLDPELPIDGIVGPQTKDALQRYQSENGLMVTGQLDYATAKKLEVLNRKPRLYVVLVGIDHYGTEGIPNLQSAVKDVHAVEKFADFQLAVQHKQILINDKATKENIIKAIGKVKQEASFGDHLVFYYAGLGGREITSEGGSANSGSEVPEGGSSFYITCYDHLPNQPESINRFNREELIYLIGQHLDFKFDITVILDTSFGQSSTGGDASSIRTMRSLPGLKDARKQEDLIYPKGVDTEKDLDDLNLIALIATHDNQEAFETAEGGEFTADLLLQLEKIDESREVNHLFSRLSMGTPRPPSVLFGQPDREDQPSLQNFIRKNSISYDEVKEMILSHDLLEASKIYKYNLDQIENTSLAYRNLCGIHHHYGLDLNSEVFRDGLPVLVERVSELLSSMERSGMDLRRRNSGPAPSHLVNALIHARIEETIELCLKHKNVLKEDSRSRLEDLIETNTISPEYSFTEDEWDQIRVLADIVVELESRVSAKGNGPRRWILVVGASQRTYSINKMKPAIDEVAKHLANEGYGLIVGGYPGVDDAMGRTFIELIKERHLDSRQYFKMVVNNERYLESDLYRDATLEDLGRMTYRVACPKVLEYVDAVILIGGGAGTQQMADAAIELNKAVFPIMSTRGTAGKVWSSDRWRSSLAQASWPAGVGQLSPENLLGPRIDDTVNAIFRILKSDTNEIKLSGEFAHEVMLSFAFIEGSKPDPSTDSGNHAELFGGLLITPEYLLTTSKALPDAGAARERRIFNVLDSDQYDIRMDPEELYINYEELGFVVVKVLPSDHIPNRSFRFYEQTSFDQGSKVGVIGMHYKGSPLEGFWVEEVIEMGDPYFTVTKSWNNAMSNGCILFNENNEIIGLSITPSSETSISDRQLSNIHSSDITSLMQQTGQLDKIFGTEIKESDVLGLNREALIDVLDSLFSENESIIEVLRDIDMDPAHINWSNSDKRVWNEILDEAQKRDLLEDLINLVLERHPENDHLLKFLGGNDQSGKKESESFVLATSNFLEDRLRRRRFNKVREKLPDAPIVLAAGDSWFQYPFIVKDIVDYLMHSYPVRSVAKAGISIREFNEEKRLFKTIDDIRPRFVLLSLGGGHFMGSALRTLLKDNIDASDSGEDVLNMEAYTRNQNEIFEAIGVFFHEMKDKEYIEQIFIHGYDYFPAYAENSKEIRRALSNKIMVEKGIVDRSLRKDLIRFLVDNFNHGLADLNSQFQKMTHLDIRGLLGKKDWYDEQHPNDRGFELVADKFVQAMEQLRQPLDYSV